MVRKTLGPATGVFSMVRSRWSLQTAKSDTLLLIALVSILLPVPVSATLPAPTATPAPVGHPRDISMRGRLRWLR